MALRNESRNLCVLLLLGVILIAYGTGSAYVASAISRVAAALVILGAAALLICYARVRSLMPKMLSASRWKRYLLFFLLVALWAGLYVEVNYFAYRYNTRWDLTRAGLHTLTDSTADVISRLYQGIRVTAFHVGLPPKYLEDLLREYKRLSGGKITTEIIDPIVHIGYAAQFGNVFSGKEQKVFVQSGSEQREVDFTGGVLTEEQLTNAIIQVTRKVRQAYFLIGHNEFDIYEEGESGLNVFQALLSANNILTKRLMLGTDAEIPKDCDVLVIAGAKEHLTKKEEDLISEYLKKGGDALFLIEQTIVTTPEKPLTADELTKNSSLNSILNDWGLNVADDVVVDLASHASGDVGSPATRNYLTHRSIVNDLDYTFFVRPRSLSIVKDRRDTVKLAPIILTASDEKSWGETNRMLQVKYDEGIDRAGPVPIAFAIWESKEEGEASDTRIIVITDADFLTNALIGQYSNARLGVNTINWLTETDYKVFFESKNIEIDRLDLTSRQKRMIGVILFLMPVFIVVIGIMVWIKQRIV